LIFFNLNPIFSRNKARTNQKQGAQRMKSLKSMMDNIQKSIEERQQREVQEDQELQDKKKIERLQKEKNNLIQLDLWANNVRGVPNSILRGSLFAAIQPKYARYVESEIIHESENIKVKYTGKRLTQTDLDVWECALHVARLQNLGNKIEITEHAFLKELGRKTTKYEYEWLRKTFERLCASCVSITHNKLTYGGSLIEQYYCNEETGHYVLIVNSKIGRLYEGSRATWIQWDERQKIGKRKPLAQWLHGYISSHAKWYPHKVETIRDYSGSETKEVRFFKKALIQALEHLQSIDIIRSYRIDEKNLVYIERPPSKTQQKYLEERKAN